MNILFYIIVKLNFVSSSRREQTWSWTQYRLASTIVLLSSFLTATRPARVAHLESHGVVLLLLLLLGDYGCALLCVSRDITRIRACSVFERENYINFIFAYRCIVHSVFQPIYGIPLQTEW